MRKRLIYLSYFTLVLGLVLASPAKAQDPNLVGWWKLDETTGFTAADSSSMGNNGFLYGGPEWTAGKFGGALDFDGTDDYVDLPIGSIISSLRSCTFAIWANFTSAEGDWQRLWDIGTDTTYYMFLCPCVGTTPNGIMRFAITTASNGGESQLNALSTLPSGWHNVTVVIDGVSRNMQLYLDGAVVASGATQILPSDLGNTTQNWLGRSQWGGDAYYSGSLDDFRIYNKVLTSDEIDSLIPRFSADRPNPADEGVATSTAITLSWRAGQTAASHHLYFGENLVDVQNGTGGTDKGTTSANTYPVANLVSGKIYYWRVDEVEANGVTIHTGQVWSFTISPKMASNPVPANETRFVNPNITLTWTAGAGATTHHVYFGTNSQDVQAGTGGTDKGTVETAAFIPTLETAKTYYWRVDEFDGTATYQGEVWRFRTMPAITVTDPNLVGWWKFDEGEGTTALDWSGKGNHGTLFGGIQWSEGYDGGALRFDGQNDYVDCGNPPSLTIQNQITMAVWMRSKGFIRDWEAFFAKGDSAYRMSRSATTGHAAHMGISGPQYFDGNKIVDDDEWHFISGVYDGTLAIIYVDGEIDATVNSTGQIGATTDNFFIGENSQARNRYFKGLLDDVRLYNRAMTQDEVKGLMKGDVTRSSNPKPANGATVDVEKALPLTWTTGEKAAQHDVYLGTNALDVESADISDTTGIYKGRQDPNTFSPPEGVKSGQTYYWRIDEVNTDGTISVGRVWSFTVANYIIVDDFEQYNNTDNQIYNTWSDYYVNNTGMTVGHFEPPFAEQDIVHGGAQSIYMRYDNDGTVNEGTDYEKSGTSFYSEAERTWADAQDWTRKGINSLTLWFRGIQGSIGSFTLGPPIKMTGIGTDIAGTADQFYFAYKKLSSNGVVTAKVLSITNTDSLAKAGVMMRESMDAGSKHFTTVACPSNRVMFVRRTTTNGAATSTSRTGVNIPAWVRLTRSGNTFTSQYSTNGTTWTTVGTPQEIQMPVDVYVGLCVTSRNVNATCTAEFSNVDITPAGTVTGDWKSQDIGLKVNSPQQLYVALQDSANNSAVVRHPNPASTTITTWTQWDIPLSAFTGVNFQSIKKLSIGVGDRANTQPGGAGDLYIDDIGLKLP